MEVFPFFLSIVVIAAGLYWSAREHRRDPSKPTSGLFRYHEVLNATLSRTKAALPAQPVRKLGRMRAPPPSPSPAAPLANQRRVR